MANLTRKFKNPLWNISKSNSVKSMPAEIRSEIANRENLTDNVANMVHKESAAIATKIASAAITIMIPAKIKNSKNIFSPPYFT